MGEDGVLAEYLHSLDQNYSLKSTYLQILTKDQFILLQLP